MQNTYTVTMERVEKGMINVVAESKEEAENEASYIYLYQPHRVHWLSTDTKNIETKLFRFSNEHSKSETKDTEYSEKNDAINSSKDWEQWLEQKEAEIKEKAKKPIPESVKKVCDYSSSVNNPKHYQGGIECIKAMEIQFGVEAVLHFCELNVFKYLWRAGKKGDAEEDIEKAKWYADYARKLRLRIEIDELLNTNDGLCDCCPQTDE